MSKFTLLLDKIISKESKDKIKINLIDPIVTDLTSNIQLYLLIMLCLYLSLLIPIIFIIILIVRKDWNF